MWINDEMFSVNVFEISVLETIPEKDKHDKIPRFLTSGSITKIWHVSTVSSNFYYLQSQWFTFEASMHTAQAKLDCIVIPSSVATLILV